MRKNSFAFALVNQKMQMKVQLDFFCICTFIFTFLSTSANAIFCIWICHNFDIEFATYSIFYETLKHFRDGCDGLMGVWVKKSGKERFRREFGCKLFWKRLIWHFFLSISSFNQKNCQNERKVKGYPFTILVIFQVFSQTRIKINLESVGKT